MGWRDQLRDRLFGNFMATLAMLLSFMQVLILHWVLRVLLHGQGLGTFGAVALFAVLSLANHRSLPVLRRLRRQTGWPRRFARAYMAGGLATLLVGLAVAFSFAGLLPLASLLGALGLSGAAACALFRASSLLLVGGLLGMLAWGFTAGQWQIERTHLRVRLDALADEHRGLRIVQISDLHIGNGLEGERLSALVAHVNAMDPDLIALTGDLFDFDPAYVQDGARRLGALRARLGVYAVLGNHDTYTGEALVAEALAERAPELVLLRGDCVRLEGALPLYIAGVDDPGRDWTARGVHMESLERLAESRPDDGPCVLLVHRPEAFPQAARLGFELVLAGHTHGGQIALPFPGGRYNLARIITRFHRGLYRRAGSTLYVNRGVGVAGPAIRFNCAREIATIELA
ncbi:MAG: metallophosphoesterase [Proteobacteria bacterium]|nr:metallophosphoesterase [Pseudomonadota bacterium]